MTENNRQRIWWTCLSVLTLALALMVCWRLLVGPGELADARIGAAILALRIDAVLVAALAGAGLAVAGVLTQGLFRNPLAAPGVIGVGAGANLGGMVALAAFELSRIGAGADSPLAGVSPELFLPLGCIAGAAITLGVLLAVLRLSSDPLTVILAGVVMGLFFGSLGGFLQALVAEQWELARAVLNFSLGDIAGKGMRHVLLAAPMVLIGIVGAWLMGRHLDLLLSGEEEAASLGVDLVATRRWAVIWCALLVAAAVAIGGNVAFVGLMVPHLIRRTVGTGHRRLVPLAALGGAVFVLACDAISATLDTRSYIPIGVITGLVGAPLFLHLLLGSRRRGAWA